MAMAPTPFPVVQNSLIFWKDEGTKGEMGWNDSSQARSTQLNYAKEHNINVSLSTLITY